MPDCGRRAAGHTATVFVGTIAVSLLIPTAATGTTASVGAEQQRAEDLRGRPVDSQRVRPEAPLRPRARVAA